MIFDWRFGFGSWLRAKAKSPRRLSVRRRKRPIDAFSPLAAEVQQLESRALLSMTYHGGALLSAVEAQSVYLGSDWQTTAALQTQIGQLNQFASTIVQSAYMDMLTNAGYNVGRGSATAGVVDNIGLTKGTSTPLTDAQIQADVQSMITGGQLQAPDANRLYMVYVEPGVVISMGGVSSATAFLGYHGAFGGHTSGGQAIDIHYAVISYPGAPNFTSASQGFSSDLADLTAVASHELAEACTDPNVNYKAGGWYDNSTGDEIGDPAEGHYATIGGFLVQDLVNQSLQIISPASSSPPPPVAVGTPMLTARALSATNASLSWNSVSGSPTGYRIFETVGTQTNLIATVSGTTTAYQVDGLTAGSQVSFKVQAFNATSSANSQVVALTMPAAPVGTPTLTAKALSATSASLAWNSVSGSPTGYRIYETIGSQTTLIATVSGTTTAYQVNGLTAGSHVSFTIQAFNATSTANSQAVALTMSAATLTAPQVGVTGVTRTTANLGWNAVSGAQGYRIYWLNGNQKILLGTASSTSTFVQIAGMTANSTYKFMVEAYNGSSVADSTWVSVTTNR